jgi:hypothetical protein
MTFEQFVYEVWQKGWLIQMMYQSMPPSQTKIGWFISVRERSTNRTEHAEAVLFQDTMRSVLFNMAQKRPTVGQFPASYATPKPGSPEDKAMLAVARKGIRPIRQRDIIEALVDMTVALEAMNAGTRGDDREDDL